MGRESLIRQLWKLSKVLGSKERGNDLVLKIRHQTPLSGGPGESMWAADLWAGSGEGSLVSEQSPITCEEQVGGRKDLLSRIGYGSERRAGLRDLAGERSWQDREAGEGPEVGELFEWEAAVDSGWLRYVVCRSFSLQAPQGLWVSLPPFECLGRHI